MKLLSPTRNFRMRQHAVHFSVLLPNRPPFSLFFSLHTSPAILFQALTNISCATRLSPGYTFTPPLSIIEFP
jgi:hypothetical protein